MKTTLNLTIAALLSTGLLATAAEDKQPQTKAAPAQTYATWIASELEGTGSSQEDAKVTADPDGDGMPNLLEYAIGGDPLFPDSEARPSARIQAGRLVYTFKRDSAKSDLIYAVESSTDMRTWRRIPSEIVRNKGSVETRSVTLPASAQLGFVRLKVSLVSQ